MGFMYEGLFLRPRVAQSVRVARIAPVILIALATSFGAAGLGCESHSTRHDSSGSESKHETSGDAYEGSTSKHDAYEDEDEDKYEDEGVRRQGPDSRRPGGY